MPFVPATAAVNLIEPAPGVRLIVAPAARVPSEPKVSVEPAPERMATLPAPAVGVSAPTVSEPTALYWNVPPAVCQPDQPVLMLVSAVNSTLPDIAIVVVALAYCSVPPETKKPPVKLLLPLSTHVPVPVLPMVSAPLLSAMTEEIVLASALAPPR